MEDWALIRRLAAEGVPHMRIAERLGISRNTVTRAVNSTEPPKYERAPAVETSFTPFEPRVRALLADTPDMPATVLAERVGWQGSSSWFRENVARLRPEQRPADPADRLVCRRSRNPAVGGVGVQVIPHLGVQVFPQWRGADERRGVHQFGSERV